jgi:two-component system, NarL family, sensor histidine kinase YdfH
MKKLLSQGPVARWLLLLWIGALYLLGAYQAGRGLLKLDLLLLFTACMALHLGLYWMSFSSRKHPRWLVLYFMMQGSIVLAISLMLHDNGLIILSLCLPLVIEATLLFRRILIVAGFAMSYLVLFGLSRGMQTFLGVDSGRGWPLIIAAPFLLVLPLFPFLLAYIQLSARERDRKLLSELEVAHAQLAAYAARVEDLTLFAERQRLARELHDTLAQGLAGLLLQLEVANAHLKQQHVERGLAIVQQAITRARATLSETRCAIDHLRGNAIQPADLPAAIQEEIDQFTTSTSVACRADLEALVHTPASCCEAVLRVLKEALSNVAHHAQAQHIWIRTTYSNTTFELEIRDDGIGFDPHLVTMQAGHYGLLGLHERVRLLGGRLELTSARGKGTTLLLCLPLQEAEEEMV